MTRYRWVEDQKADGYPTTMACEVVEVSTSAFYEWRQQREAGPTDAEVAEADLVERIRSIHADSDGTYGAPRITEELNDHDDREPVNHKRVERLMRSHGIVGASPTRKVRTTIPAPSRQLPDLLGRLFDPGAIDRAWVGDISYIPTWQGWLYLATVVDLGSRRVIGYAMADHMRAELVCDALAMAIDTRGGVVAGVVFHSDRGTQYLSEDFAALCQRHGITRSVGRTGICWDNAVAEAFFATLKKELVHRYIFETRAQARRAIFRWIQGWYNRRRRHSSLGYRSPQQWEHDQLRSQPDPMDQPIAA